MRIAVVHNHVTGASTPDEHDVLMQVEAVCAALEVLGHQPFPVAITLNLDAVRLTLEEMRPEAVFNLVESLAGRGRLIHLFPALLETYGLPFTGACADAILLTSNKIAAKVRLTTANLPTPAWIGPYPYDITPLYGREKAADTIQRRNPATRWIIKSLWEHASIGMDADELVFAQGIDLANDLLKKRAAELGGACFAEIYIHGREFNLSLLAGPGGPQVLPPAEILFQGFADDKPRIVNYRAKWDQSSYEYHHTPRCFDFLAQDAPLLEQLKEIAIRCWHVFGLGGYARVDFRVDAQGQPWILEINTNPCLSPDAGFAAAVAQAGLSFPEAVNRILKDALKRSGE